MLIPALATVGGCSDDDFDNSTEGAVVLMNYTNNENCTLFDKVRKVLITTLALSKRGCNVAAFPCSRSTMPRITVLLP